MLGFIRRLDRIVEKPRKVLVRGGSATLSDVTRDAVHCSRELISKVSMPRPPEFTAGGVHADGECMRSQPSLDPLEVSHPRTLTFPNFSMSSFAIEAKSRDCSGGSSRGQFNAA